MSKILITGAAGFIGSHLSNYYLNNNCKVIGIDDFSSSKKNSKHFKSLKKNKYFTYVVGSVEELERNEFKNIDIIYHFACPASPPIYSSIPIKTLDTCFNGTKSMLEIARYNKCQIIGASTSEVYGNASVPIQTESYYGNVNSFGPRSCYDEGKRVAEALYYEYLKLGLNVKIPRIFNTYGPHMDKDDGRVITNFIRNSLTNSNLLIHGKKELSRSFCYIDDLIEALVKLKDVNINSPINLGNPKMIKIIDLANLILGLTNSKSSIQYVGEVEDDPVIRKPDISLAKSLLKWEPKTNLKTGLTHTINYIKSNYEIKTIDK